MNRWRSITAVGMVATSGALVFAQQNVAPLPKSNELKRLPRPAVFQADAAPATAPEPAPMPPESIAPLAPREVPAQAMSLADAENIALGNHPALARAAARVAAARGEWVQVGLKPNPVAGYDGAEMGDEHEAGKQGAFVSQEFVTAGKLGLNRAVAAQEIRRMEAELEAERYRVVADVQAVFYEALIAQETIRVVGDLLRISEESVKTTDVLYQRGELSRVELRQTQIEASRTRLLLDEARGRRVSALRRLSAVLGGAEVPDQLSGDARAKAPEISWDDALGRLLAESPEIAAAQASVDKASWAVSRARAGRIPNVEVEASVQHDNVTQDDVASLKVGVPFPIFDRNQGEIQKARAELAAAHSDVVRTELDLKRRLAESYETYENARRRVSEYDAHILPDSKESLDLVGVLFKNGETGYLTLLTTQRTYVETHVSYLEALRQLRKAVAEIDGMLLEGSLEER